MGKYKYLLKNIGVLTLSNFATKLLSFLLVPLYTSILTTSEYGIYDLFNTTVSLLVPLLTIDIQEAVLRFSMDNEANHRDIFSIGSRYTFFSCIIIGVAVLINNFFVFSSILKKYAVEFLLLYICYAFSGVISYFSRGIARIVDLSIAGILSSVVMISSNIIFLVFLKVGLHGYFIATILGWATQSIYLLLRIKCWNFIKFTQNTKLRHEMVNYSRPMVANAVSWWINNASDRYVVTYICGIAVNGIYSVGYKIPSIISILQNIFGQAWTLSAVKDFDPEDKSGFLVNIYNLYNFLLVLMCSALILIDKPIAKFLFAEDFYTAWIYAPFLMISTVFSGMAGYIGGLFSALKKSNSFARTSIITALLNTILNFLLVFQIGAIGAAIATAIAYFVMWYLRLVEIKKYVKLRVNLKRDLAAYFVLLLQSFLLITIRKDKLISWEQIPLFIIIILLYAKEIYTGIIKKIYRKRY